MIRVLVGNMFESKMATLVNTVNCVGVMGKGYRSGREEKVPANVRGTTYVVADPNKYAWVSPTAIPT